MDASKKDRVFSLKTTTLTQASFGVGASIPMTFEIGDSYNY